MTRAYDRALLGRASDTLGRMLDFASRSLHHDVHTVMSLFCASGLAARFGSGDIRLIAGMSGIELAYAVLDRSGIAYERTVPRHTGGYSPEYWLGWALARAQWESCLPFRTVTAYFPAQDFMADYTKKRTEYLAGLPLDISDAARSSGLRDFGENYAREAAEAVLPLLTECSAESCGRCLKEARTQRGLSQSGLAAVSGIPVRTIQQYEQGQKDLRKARAEYIIALSHALGCAPERLLMPSASFTERM